MARDVASVKIDGTLFPLAHREGAYQEYTQRISIVRNQVPGASRPAEPKEPDALEVTYDDWTHGEGYKFFDLTPDHVSQKGYFQSNVGVDVTIPGQISLGFDDQLSNTGAFTVTGGSYLRVAGGNLWTVFNQTSRELVSGTWTARTNALTAAVVGAIASYGNTVYVATEDEIGKITSSANSNWVSSANANFRAPLITDNRLYVLKQGTTSSSLVHYGLDTAGTEVSDYPMPGIGSDFASAPIAQVAVGSSIYILTASNDDDPILHVFERGSGRILARLESFRVNSAEPGLQVMAAINGVVFIGGWNADDERPEVRYFDGQFVRSLGAFREEDGATKVGKVTALAAGRENELLIGTAKDGVAAHLFRYRLDGSGISVVGRCSTNLEQPTSLAYHNGVYYVAGVDIGQPQHRVENFDTGKYETSATVTLPIWDGGMPNTEKVLKEVEIHSKTLPASTSIEIQFGVDGAAASTVTTDATGASMAHSSGGRTKFTISDSDTERTFRYMQPNLVLKTSVTTSFPTGYSVTFRAIPIVQQQFYECLIDLSPDRIREVTHRGRTPQALFQIFRDLRDATANRVWTFTPIVLNPGGHYPNTEGQVNVKLEESRFFTDGQGGNLLFVKFSKF